MLVTTIVNELVELLTTNDQDDSKQLAGIETALLDISKSIRELSNSIDRLSDSVISTVQDEHELRHYGHLKTAIRSLAAARVDPITLKDAKCELDCAKEYCVSGGGYWLTLLEYESLMGCPSLDTLRHAFAYNQTDPHFENTQRVHIYFYLLRLSIPLAESIAQDVFPLLLEGLDDSNFQAVSRNDLAVAFIELSFLSESNIELLKKFTQESYAVNIGDSIEILKVIDDIPLSIEAIKLPILSAEKPAIAEKNILERGAYLIEAVERLEEVIEESKNISGAIAKTEPSYFIPLSFIGVSFFCFFIEPLSIWGSYFWRSCSNILRLHSS